MRSHYNYWIRNGWIFIAGCLAHVNVDTSVFTLVFLALALSLALALPLALCLCCGLVPSEGWCEVVRDVRAWSQMAESGCDVRTAS